MLCKFLFVYFVQLIFIVTPVSAAEDLVVNAYKEKQPGFFKFDDKFCLSNDFKDKQVMKVISKLELECRSKEQIKWIFSSPITLKESLRLSSSSLPFTINSTVEKCGSILNGTLNYYFTSILNLKNDHYVNDPNNWTVKIQCGHYQESTLSQFLPTIQVEKKPNKVIQPLDNHKIREEWMENKTGSMDCDPVHLQKNDHGLCSCKSGTRGGFVDVHFLACDNLVDCELLAEGKEGFYGKICPANLVNECNSSLVMSPQSKLDKSGLLYCTRSTGAKIPYVPYLFSRLEMNSSNSAYKEIQILTNNISTYGQFLTISTQDNNSRKFSTKSNIHFQCSGPSFIFLKEFRWTLKSDNSSIESSLRHYSAPLPSLEDTIVSNLTIQVQQLKLREDVNVTINCEGAVRNGHGFVQSNDIIIQLLVRRPEVKKSINCPENQLIQYKCQTELGVDLTWWNEKTGHKLKTNTQGENSYYFKSCPNYTIICTASKDDLQTSRYFEPQNCQHYLIEHVNCTRTKFRTRENETRRAEGWTTGQLIFVIIGSIIGLIILIALTLAAIFRNSIRLKWRKNVLNSLTEQEIREFIQGKSTLDPDDLHSPIYALPFDPQFEISRQHLIFDTKYLLGSGHFGIVMKGQIQRSEGELIQVAIKTVKSSANYLHLKALMAEIKIMAYLGHHLNIVTLIGACTENMRQGEIYAAVEFCSKGDLYHLLRKSRDSFQNLFPPRGVYTEHEGLIEGGAVSAETSGVSTIDLLNWALGISSGLAHLSHKKVIHGDLAARNVCISGDNVAKVGDFGLSRELLSCYGQYVKSQRTALPFRWMAPESLHDLTFSIQSDVWSFGVTLWELFSLGKTPYPNFVWNANFTQQISTGYRLEQPEFSNDEIYNLMRQCWNFSPTERPKVAHLFERFQLIVNQLTNLSQLNYYCEF